MTLEVVNGEFRYPSAKKAILRDVNIRLKTGELLAILGPNGAGKTTLLRTMIGLQQWSSGVTKVSGVDLSQMTPREIGSTIAYVPQARSATTLSLSGIEMVELGRASRLGTFAQPSVSEQKMAQEVLERIGVPHLGKMRCATMSGGQFQMILIARALIAEPKILVLDEPETGLDFHNQLVVLQLLRRLADEGLIVVMNTHYPAHALQIADQALLISKTHQTISGPISEVMTQEKLSHLFDVAVRILKLNFDGKEIETVVPISLQ